MACECKICGKTNTMNPDTWVNWDCSECRKELFLTIDGTIPPNSRRRAFKKHADDFGEAIMAGKARLLITMMLMLCAVGFGALQQWQDDSAIESRVNNPAGVFRGNLIGGGYTEVSSTNRGIQVFDGQWCVQGGKTKTSTDYQCIKGIDDVGLFVIVTSGSTTTLQKSSDGLTDFVDVLSPDGTYLSDHQLVDCGRHTLDDGDGQGDVERRVLLFFEYHTANTNVWYSAEPNDLEAGDSGNWTALFSSDAVAIKHFHGAKYFKGKGLYVFTGDAGTNNNECSIMFCSKDDIDNLIESSITWYDTNWQLGTGDRAGWSADYKSNYILWGGNQGARTVELVSADNRTAYYIPDRLPYIEGVYDDQYIHKVDFYATDTYACGEVDSTPFVTGLSNTGWFGGASKSGMIYLTNIANRNATDTDWETGHVGHVEVFAIDSENEDFKKVKSYPAGVYQTANSWHGLNMSLQEYGGTMFAQMTALKMDWFSTNDAWYGRSAILAGYVPKQKRTSTNYITNGTFTDGTTGWYINSYNRMVIDAGGNEISASDVITGATSGATATVSGSLTNTGGTWGGNDWAGYFNLTNMSGVFQENEILKVGETECATVNGFATYEVIADPTGQKGGNVVRLCAVHNGLTTAPSIGTHPTPGSSVLTAANKAALEGSVITFQFEFYQESASDGDLDTRITCNPAPAVNTVTRMQAQDETEDVWRTLWSSALAAEGSSSNTWYMTLTPDNSTTDGETSIIYATDFRIIRGSLPDNQIDQLNLSSGSSGMSEYYPTGRPDDRMNTTTGQ